MKIENRLTGIRPNRVTVSRFWLRTVDYLLVSELCFFRIKENIWSNILNSLFILPLRKLSAIRTETILKKLVGLFVYCVVCVCACACACAAHVF